MDKLIVNGTANLKGSINIYGAKNAALPIMACSLLSDQNLKLNNLPNVEDINSMKKLLYNFGSNRRRSLYLQKTLLLLAQNKAPLSDNALIFFPEYFQPQRIVLAYQL